MMTRWKDKSLHHAPAGGGHLVALWLLVATLLLSPLNGTQAGELDSSVDRLVQRELAHLGTAVHARAVGELPSGVECTDPTLSLPRGYNPHSARLYVGVSCDDQQFFIQAQLSVLGSYLRTTREIEAGTILTREMIEIAEGDITAMLGTMAEDAGAVIGSIARRDLSRGQPLLTRNLKVPKLVTRGDRVSVETAGRGFRIALKGEALQAGRIGDRIKVRISRSRVLSAVIAGPGRAIVQL